MKRVMTLRRSAALVRARAGGDDQSTRAEIGDFNYLTLPAKFTICRANYILLLELYTQKNKSFCLLSGKAQSDISPPHTPRWKCLFQPPDIYIPALTPFPSILIVWSCQGFGWPGFTAVWRRRFLETLFRERETGRETEERNLPKLAPLLEPTHLDLVSMEIDVMSWKGHALGSGWLDEGRTLHVHVSYL